MGDDTIGAEIITPLNHGNEPRYLIHRFTFGKQAASLIRPEEIHLGTTRPALLNVAHHIAQQVYIVGAADDVEIGYLLQHALPFLLGHAAAYGKDQPGSLLFERFESAEMPVNLTLGPGADGTGIQNNEIGPVGTVDLLISKPLYQVHDLLGIDHIHLAPEGFQVKTLHNFLLPILKHTAGSIADTTMKAREDNHCSPHLHGTDIHTRQAELTKRLVDHINQEPVGLSTDLPIKNR
jgi:hypothetical protein